MMTQDDRKDDEADNARCKFLSVAEAADYLGLKRSTLDHYRWVGGGPRYRKHGGRVKYLERDLEAWSESRQFQDTATRVR
ncbi:MAG: helix-turn-helix domain-containing protein [Amphiplicatus sp.]